MKLVRRINHICLITLMVTWLFIIIRALICGIKEPQILDMILVGISMISVIWFMFRAGWLLACDLLEL